jgi:glutamate racemase
LSDNPIGIFDSGVGGLSVLREVRRELPYEPLLYVADSGYAPYGDRPAAFIIERSTLIVDFLIALQCKAIVVACNTATAVAVEALRAQFTLPIVAIEPAVKPAAATTRSGVVGVLATTQTLTSAKFGRLVDDYGGDATVLTQACPGLVEQVEAGDLVGPRTRALVEEYAAPLVDQGADTLVLGCTHYPFLTPLIQEVVGLGVTIIDPAVAVARELRRRLGVANLLSESCEPGTERFWTSGALERLAPTIARLWGTAVDVGKLPV